MNRLRIPLTALFLAAAFALPAGAQQTFESIEQALGRSALFSGASGPQSVNWIDGGRRFSYLVYNPNTSRTEIRSSDPATGADALIFDGQGLTFPGTDQPFEYESFQWTADSRHLLFETDFRPIYRRSGIADYYYYSLGDKTLRLVADDAGTAEVSPDGRSVGFERGGELYRFDFATGTETRLTHDASPGIFNGRFGWVYEEEFGLAQAWTWSPDSRHIAFWQEDERGVPLFQMSDMSGQTAEYITLKYPKVGQTNPIMRIGVADVTTGALTWLETGEHPDSYIPRIYWTAEPGQLAVVWMNRAQNHLKLFFFDVKTGQRRLVMEERSDSYIDAYNFFEGISHHMMFPAGQKEFYWLSDRDGYRHIYRYGYDGRLLNQVTRGNWEVTNVHGFDARAKTIYYSSTEASPLERQLYRVGVDGRGKRRITTESGTHRIDMGPDTRYFINRWSNVSTPTQVVLRNQDGRVVRTLEDNAGVRRNTATYAYAPRVLKKFRTAEGHDLDALVLYPIGFDSTKTYPVVLDIYGGPGSQSVYNQWESSMWRQYLAHAGYLVVSVNNRGSSGYGRDFEKQVYGNLGELEAADFAHTAAWLKSLPYVDGGRLAIRGHSYGGYMVLYTMTAHPGVFQVGLSGAPVADWRLYDTIYTERYMNLLGANEAGYVKSSPITRADRLQGDLLLVHSLLDENVHVQHTFQFAQALISHRIDHDLRIFPPGAHGVAWDRNSYLYLYRLYIDYLKEHLN